MHRSLSSDHRPDPDCNSGEPEHAQNDGDVRWSCVRPCPGRCLPAPIPIQEGRFTVDTEVMRPAAASAAGGWSRTSHPKGVRIMHRVNRRRAYPIGKFLVVGCTGLIVNNAVLYASYELLRLPLALASTLATSLAVGNNFFFNDRWTFNGQRQMSTIEAFARFGLISVA